MARGRDELCVVGDPSQTIYSFTGATPHHLLTFSRTHPKAQVIRLVRDYRSTPQVVNLANQLLARAGRAGGAHQALELVAQRPAGPPVAFTAYDDDEAEASGIAQRIGRLLAAGTRASEIAVLYRTNAQSEAFESALADAGIGYLVRGGERFFQRKEVRDAIVLLRGAARSADPDVPMPETVRDVLAAAGWAPRRRPRAARRGSAGSPRRLSSRSPTTSPGSPRRPTPRPRPSRPSSPSSTSARRGPARPDGRGSDLASLHAAKGLEWDAVFLAGMSEGLMPISSRRRTRRSRRSAGCSTSASRGHASTSSSRSRARATPAAGRRAGARGSSTGSGPTSRACAGRDVRARGSQGPAHGEYDQALFEELREWRRQVAQETDKPAFTVLVDSALAAVAETRPTSQADLARINGLGPAKIERYGATISRSCAARRADEPRPCLSTRAG